MGQVHVYAKEELFEGRSGRDASWLHPHFIVEYALVIATGRVTDDLGCLSLRLCLCFLGTRRSQARVSGQVYKMRQCDAEFTSREGSNLCGVWAWETSSCNFA